MPFDYGDPKMVVITFWNHSAPRFQRNQPVCVCNVMYGQLEFTSARLQAVVNATVAVQQLGLPSVNKY